MPLFLITLLLLSACAGATSSTAGGGGATMAATLPAGVTPALIAQGDSLYHQRACARCHGPAGRNGPNGPDLADGAWLHHSGSYSEIVRTITDGVPRAQLKDQTRRFAMNPRGGGQQPLNDDEIRALAAYVWSLSHPGARN